MNRYRAMAMVLMTLCGATLAVPACAAPPTVTPSPGYDARLQEQHAASRGYGASVIVPGHRHRVRRVRHAR